MSNILNLWRTKGARGRQALRLALALIGLLGCHRLIMDGANMGLSRLLTTNATILMDVGLVDRAVRLTPKDPEAHYTRALALVNSERLDEAVIELRTAIQLRPEHYYEWLDLGVTLDRLGDESAAASALNTSVQLAPGLAQPRWQLGNLFFRQGRYQEAFEQLRLGVVSNPNLLQGMMDLAWVASDGNVEEMKNLIRPESQRHRLELAKFLERHGNASDAAREAVAVGKPQGDDGSALLRQIVRELIVARKFSESYAVWASGVNNSTNGTTLLGEVLNGDFVEPVSQNDTGWGWQLMAGTTLEASVDPSGPTSGARSLRLEFRGAADVGSNLVSQLVLLQPNNHYSLKFMSKADGLVSGGPPLIFVLDGSSEQKRILGQSKPLGPGSTEWTAYEVDFSTDNGPAITVALQRLACDRNPCPIFGRLWLSGFSIRKR